MGAGAPTAALTLAASSPVAAMEPLDSTGCEIAQTDQRPCYQRRPASSGIIGGVSVHCMHHPWQRQVGATRVIKVWIAHGHRYGGARGGERRGAERREVGSRRQYAGTMQICRAKGKGRAGSHQSFLFLVQPQRAWRTARSKFRSVTPHRLG